MVNPPDNCRPLIQFKKLAPWLIGLVVVAALLGLGSAYPTFPGDEKALHLIRESRRDWLNDAAAFISAVGSGGFDWVGIPFIPIGLVAGLLAAGQWKGSLFLAAASLAPVVNLGLKELVTRPRPDVQLALVGESGYAFPSGHAVFVAAFWGAVIVLAEESSFFRDRARLRRVLQGALFPSILVVGASRVYLGVHWPSDVIAGFLFGGLYLGTLIVLLRPRGIRRHSRCV